MARVMHHQTLGSGTNPLNPHASGVPDRVRVCDIYISNNSGAACEVRKVSATSGGITIADGDTHMYFGMLADDGLIEVEGTGDVEVTYICATEPSIGEAW